MTEEDYQQTPSPGKSRSRSNSTNSHTSQTNSTIRNRKRKSKPNLQISSKENSLQAPILESFDHAVSDSEVNYNNSNSNAALSISEQKIEQQSPSDLSSDLPLTRARSRIIHENTSTSHAFWNLTKGFVGAASFALPWAVSKTGIIPALFGFILLACLSSITFRWLLIASHCTGSNLTPTFPELAEIVFSNFFPIFPTQSMQTQTQIQMQIQNQNHADNPNNSMRRRSQTHNRNLNHQILIEDHSSSSASEEEMKTLVPDGNTISQQDILYEQSKAHPSPSSVKNTHQLLAYEAREYRHAQANIICGKIGKIIVAISMFLSMVGACGSYILFITQVLFDWLLLVFPSLNHSLTVLCFLPFPMALSLLRSYKYLAMTAKFGVIAVMLALIVVVYDGSTRIANGVINAQEIYDHVVWFDMASFPIFVGNASFLFIIHVMVLSQEQSMQDRTQFAVSKQFTKASTLSLMLVTIVNGLFSTYAYITFSDYSTDKYDNIVNVLDEGPIQIVTKVCLCVDLLFTYALIMYPFTEALDTELFHPHTLNTKSVLIKGNVIRLAIVCVTALIAMFIPFFGYLTGLTGGSASVFVGLILPPIFVWRLAPRKISQLELYLLCPAVFLFGCIMFIWSPYLIISEMQTKMS